LGRIVDGELEAITPVLLRKSTDTNVFISEQSIKAIENMCESCGESRVAIALLGGV